MALSANATMLEVKSGPYCRLADSTVSHSAGALQQVKGQAGAGTGGEPSPEHAVSPGAQRRKLYLDTAFA